MRNPPAWKPSHSAIAFAHKANYANGLNDKDCKGARCGHILGHARACATRARTSLAVTSALVSSGASQTQWVRVLSEGGKARARQKSVQPSLADRQRATARPLPSLLARQVTPTCAGDLHRALWPVPSCSPFAGPADQAATGPVGGGSRVLTIAKSGFDPMEARR